MTLRPATRTVLLAGFIVLASASCAGVDDGLSQSPQVKEIVETHVPPLPKSGVEGQVWLGPTCPGAQVGSKCPDEPFEAQLTVTDSDGQVVTRGLSDKEGVFRIPLAPGDYVLVPESPNRGVPPYASQVPFNVSLGAFTQITVTYDSGIR